jgi:hypothetical protein
MGIQQRQVCHRVSFISVQSKSINVTLNYSFGRSIKKEKTKAKLVPVFPLLKNLLLSILPVPAHIA